MLRRIVRSAFTDSDEKNMKGQLTARQRHVKGVRMRRAAVVRSSQMALVACLVAVLLATSLTAAAAWGATGGVPGTGDKSFNPAATPATTTASVPRESTPTSCSESRNSSFSQGSATWCEAGEFYVYFNAVW